MLHNPSAVNFPRPHASGRSPHDATLHVCSMVSNPVRYASRYRLHEAFAAQNRGVHVEFWTVEVAYGNRRFAVTEQGNPRHLQLRSSSEIWLKENALNLLFAEVVRQFPDAEYIAWPDADITFARADWAYETIQQLQHYDWVQMFSHAMDVGPKYQPVGRPQQGFVWAYYNDPEFFAGDKKYGYRASGHPGYAWAARRSALDAVGGLIDYAIVGGADRHMACGLIGVMEQSGPYKEAVLTDLSPNLRNSLLLWQERAKALNRNIGYVDGQILHHWHGKKVDRKYGSRWKIYTENRYDPWADLRRDVQGLYQIPAHKHKLRDDLRSYLRSRNEDSLEVDE